MACSAGMAGCVWAAPAGQAAPAGLVQVARSLGTLQCQAGGPSVLDLARQAREAGLTVQATACASDGRMRVAMCGAADGRLGVLTLPAGEQAAAEKLGFKRLADLPGAQAVACP